MECVETTSRGENARCISVLPVPERTLRRKPDAWQIPGSVDPGHAAM